GMQTVADRQLDLSRFEHGHQLVMRTRAQSQLHFGVIILKVCEKRRDEGWSERREASDPQLTRQLVAAQRRLDAARRFDQRVTHLQQVHTDRSEHDTLRLVSGQQLTAENSLEIGDSRSERRARYPFLLG